MNVLILGANSDIAKATAKALACKYPTLQLTLASRKMETLQHQATSLMKQFNVKTTTCVFDADDFDSHLNFYHHLTEKPDIVICAFGQMNKEPDSELSLADTQHIINRNFAGAVNILQIIAKDMSQRQHGCIVGISSVAGDRGRASNGIYCAAKAGFTAYLSSLRNRLHKDHVHVLTVLPGIISTKMTEHTAYPRFLFASAETVANNIVRAISRKRNVIYTPWIWRWLMLIIKWIPEFVFKRLLTR